MIKTILLALDGSETSEKALPVAAGLARRAKAHLVAAHALDFINTEYTRGKASDWLNENAEDRASNYLDAVAEFTEKTFGVHMSTRIGEGAAVHGLLEQSDAVNADLIVMASHGYGGFTRFWLGSVADRVVRHGHTSVLVVHATEDDTHTPVSDAPFSHILVPLDGSEISEQALGVAAEIARLDGARITLLRVVSHVLAPALTLSPVPLMNLTPMVSAAELEAQMQEYLDELSGRVELNGLNVTRLVRTASLSIAQEILNVVERTGVDLIVMPTHGRGGVSRFMIGSVADKVIRGATVPVLVHKETA